MIVRKRYANVVDQGVDRGPSDPHSRVPWVHQAIFHPTTKNYEPLCTRQLAGQIVTFGYVVTTKAVTCPQCKEM